MGDMFRSSKMSLCQLFIQPEAAYATVAELGETGCVQFRDMNHGITSYQRKFVNEVTRCNELERIIHYIEGELKKDGIAVNDDLENIPNAPNPREIIELEAQLERTETEIIELAQNHMNLQKNFLELTEMIKVLEKTEGFFSDQEMNNIDTNKYGVGGREDSQRGQLGFVAGVIQRERAFAFERMLWRISRGNVFVRRTDIDEALKDPKTGASIYKTIFVVFFQGDQLKTRIKKVCTGFHAAMYPCPSSHKERLEMSKGVRIRLDDLKTILAQTDDHRSCVLKSIAKKLPTWTVMIKKSKSIYFTLNMFNIDVSNKCLIAEGWVPTKDIGIVQKALADGTAAVGSSVPSFLNVMETHEKPPTYNRTNKFTRGFQNLIDAYGIATYREVNPALYTCITFPFLFAVMFGDMGHGFILLLFGMWMTIDEKRLMKRKGGEIWNIFFSGRYIILLMGLFAIYTGFMYNDCFSKSFNIFGTTWRVRYNTTTVLSNPILQLNPTTASYGVYPMGLDPIWQYASNKIIFLNTYKMKLSIIIGVLHMVFGVCMSVENFVFFKKYAYIFLEFLPQVIFLLLLFGYMVFMMFFKWVKYSSKTDYQPDTPGCAPSVLIMFINMVLFKTSPVLEGCDGYMFSVQSELQTIFVVVALICIPWMLIGKPLYIQCTRKSTVKKMDLVEVIEYSNTVELVEDQTATSKADVSPGSAEHGEGEEEDEEPMSEIWIHQAIHTIEYVLSTISHTASYLRLWALSLAHAQLSEVLWNMVLTLGLQFKGYPGSIGLFVIFAIWVFFTMAIMVMMEGLSAFLHTLRLHWVEFMSKFYEGAGYAFEPFSFKAILSEEDED